MSTPKKPIDIEKLLHWAYRDELPKQAVSGLTGWEKLIYLGTNVDESDRAPDVQMPAACGPPHPDALRIDWIVRGLEDVRIQWPSAAAGLLGPLMAWLREEELPLVRSMKAQTSALVQAHARMGTRPVWQMPHRPIRVIGRNGKPLIVGITSGRRYAPGAHGMLRMDPPVPEILSARFEYFVWRSALAQLASESWNLVDHAPQQPAAAQAPWLTGEERRPRILETTSSRDVRLTTPEVVA